MSSQITERQFQRSVIELAQALGWKVYYVPDSRRSPAGFPDLVLLKPGNLIFAELKTSKGRLRPQQREWLNNLRTLGRTVRTYLWRPDNWDEIVEILQNRRSI